MLAGFTNAHKQQLTWIIHVVTWLLILLAWDLSDKQCLNMTVMTGLLSRFLHAGFCMHGRRQHYTVPHASPSSPPSSSSSSSSSPGLMLWLSCSSANLDCLAIGCTGHPSCRCLPPIIIISNGPSQHRAMAVIIPYGLWCSVVNTTSGNILITNQLQIKEAWQSKMAHPRSYLTLDPNPNSKYYAPDQPQYRGNE